MSPLRLIALAAAALLAGCGGPAAGESERTEVVAALYPLAWAAAQIAGDSASVRNLTAPGVEPHDLELSAREVARLRAADLVLYFGHDFQPAVEAAVGASERAVDLLDGLELREPAGAEEHGDGHEHEDEMDPHVWLDPVLFTRVIGRIGEALGERERAAQLAARVRALDDEYRNGLRSCARNEVVVSHAAFGYLTDRYGLEQIPIAGLSPEAEPTPRRLGEVIERVRELGATTIFFETLVSPRVAEVVARATGARTAVLDPVEGLTEDQLARGDDYVSVMRRNLQALRRALECR